jgi:hypothetical protein
LNLQESRLPGLKALPVVQVAVASEVAASVLEWEHPSDPLRALLVVVAFFLESAHRIYLLPVVLEYPKPVGPAQGVGKAAPV